MTFDLALLIIILQIINGSASAKKNVGEVVNYINYQKSKSRRIKEIINPIFLSIAEDRQDEAIEKLKRDTKIESEIFKLIIEANEYLRSAIYYEKNEEWQRRKDRLELSLSRFEQAFDKVNSSVEKYDIVVTLGLYSRYMFCCCQSILYPTNKEKGLSSETVYSYLQQSIKNREDELKESVLPKGKRQIRTAYSSELSFLFAALLLGLMPVPSTLFLGVCLTPFIFITENIYGSEEMIEANVSRPIESFFQVNHKELAKTLRNKI